MKRHRANVQRADIDRFIGALSGRFPQGVFITTAGYAREAARKAAAGFPHVATVDGEQVVALMLRHRLGVGDAGGAAGGLDEAYFAQFELLAGLRPGGVGEGREAYRAGTDGDAGRAARPEDDLITLRGLSHALRVDTTTLRRLMEQGRLLPDHAGRGAWGSTFFRRDRVTAIRAELRGAAHPSSPDEWRREFLDFTRSRNLSKSYKPVLLLALLKLVDRDGAAHIGALATEFRAFYVARRRAGLPVEFGPPDLSDAAAVSDAQLRQLVVRHPLERFLIKGFLEYQPEAGVVRFAPALWAELRAWELLDIRRNAEEQLCSYYGRPR